MRSRVDPILPLILIAGIAGSTGAQAKSREPALPVNGPAADYPVVLGEPLQIGGTTYAPEDRLNYDAVGYAAIAGAGGANVSAAHKTLPLPSYAEVTALDSGRTILVRVERRGPMNDRLIELSPGAAAQLGLAAGARPAVRVRRVNPPEQERAALRAGNRAPERMATPKGLLDALNRKLAAGAIVPSAKPQAQPVAASANHPAATPGATTKLASVAKPAPLPVAKPVTAPAQVPAATGGARPVAGSLVVQVAALSTQANAGGLARKLGGGVSPAGRLWRVRLGPFASRGEAEAALAKAKGAGYSDARIQRAD